MAELTTTATRYHWRDALFEAVAQADAVGENKLLRAEVSSTLTTPTYSSKYGSVLAYTATVTVRLIERGT